MAFFKREAAIRSGGREPASGKSAEHRCNCCVCLKSFVGKDGVLFCCCCFFLFPRANVLSEPVGQLLLQECCVPFPVIGW